MGFEKILFGEKDLGLDLHERDFTRFWLNKYERNLEMFQINWYVYRGWAVYFKHLSKGAF